MPKDNFRSITVSKDVFDRFDLIYKRNKRDGKLNPGIVSFSGFFTEQMNNSIEDNALLTKFAKRIMSVPVKFTETKLVLKKIKPY